MMTVQECIQYVESHLEIRTATENGAYTCGRTIVPNGAVNHSVGCAQPNPDVFFKNMNKGSAGWGVNAIIGGFHQGEGKSFFACALTKTLRDAVVTGVLDLGRKAAGTTPVSSGRSVNLRDTPMPEAP